MIYTYSHPHTTFQRIDTAPIEARLWLIHNLVMRLLDIGLTQRLLPLGHKVRRLARVLARAQAHNQHVENKLAMLFNPLWRERVLRDLGGMHKLQLWDAAMLRARGVLPAARRNLAPVKAEPVWWRSPERVVESERLKARFRLCMDASVTKQKGVPREFRDPYKMDFEGQFRLAPIPRFGARQKPLPRIYSKVDICEYNYNEIPVQKPKDFGPAMVWPLEFYAAMTLEVEGDTRGLNGVAAMVRELRLAEGDALSPVILSPVIPSPVNPSPVNPSPVNPSPVNPSPVNPSFVIPGEVRCGTQEQDTNDDSEDDEEVNNLEFEPNFLPLSVFLGGKIHEALFRVPP